MKYIIEKTISVEKQKVKKIILDKQKKDKNVIRAVTSAVTFFGIPHLVVTWLSLGCHLVGIGWEKVYTE